MVRINCKIGDCDGWYDLDANDRHYCVRQYRYGDIITIWVGDQNGNAKRSRHVWLKWTLFSSPADRIRNKRLKLEALAKKLNHHEIYLTHEVAIAKR